MHKLLKKCKDFRLIPLITLLFYHVNAQDPPEAVRFQFSHSGMGSLFTIVGYGSDTGKASRIAMASFAMVDSLNLIMSDYNPESELMRLSRLSGNGKWIPVSDELYEIIRESLCWSRRTDGLFDITVGAYSQLWRRAGRKEKIPDTLMLNNAASVVGFKYIKLNKNKQAVKLTKPGIQLDLGGIAKGYTVDRIFELFRSNGFDAVLVDGGGDIRTGENPPGSRGWKIVIETQYSTDSIAYVENSAIATSGDLFRFTEINGIRYSHIINPRTGYGITIPRTVTVTAPDCTTADVLSSFLSISGPDKGFKSLDKLDGVDAIIVEIENGDKKIYRYSGR